MSERGEGAVLGRVQLLSAIAAPQPLLTGYASLDEQIQPNGFDLSVESIGRLRGRGSIGVDNRDRSLPDVEQIAPDDDDWWALAPGQYHLVYRETVALPADLMAFGRPRSSLCRSGVTIHTSVWDAGYHGRSTSLLSVDNPDGFRLQRGARVTQLVFIRLISAVAEGYSGIYQSENMRSSDR